MKFKLTEKNPYVNIYQEKCYGCSVNVCNRFVNFCKLKKNEII